MKRYEKMTKEDIIESYGGTGIGYNREHSLWLLEEVPTKKVHRYDLIDSPTCIDRMRKEFHNQCHGQYCGSCIYCYIHDKNGMVGCFTEYLSEEIEVEDDGFK